MAEARHLEKAPITEALVDIRVKLPPTIDLSTLDSIHALFAKEYPEKRERIKMEGEFDFKAKEFSRKTSVVDGYLCFSADKKQAVQIRLDGFTFSRLKPYESWGSLRKEAFRLWQLYVQYASPELITRVALRYINRLEVPLPIRDFSEYLTAPPTVPQNLPQEWISFLTRNVILDQSLDAVAIITQSLDPIGTAQVAPILLDIDVFKEGQFAVDGIEAWRTTDNLREFKNRIFFGSVTEKALEAYQ